MKNKRWWLAMMALISIAGFIAYRSIVPSDYCFSQKRVIPDGEFIGFALRAREAEMAYYGGIDAYEERLVKVLHVHPEAAGRDFDISDPGCCLVFRNYDEVQRCGMSSPVCVRLLFPKRKDLNFIRQGKTYFYDECGKLIKNI